MDITTAEQFTKCTGCRMAFAKEQMGRLQVATYNYNIDTANRLSAFLAMITAESQVFTSSVEHFNYSVNRLITCGFSYDDAMKYGRTDTQQANEEHIASILLANKLGNGDVSSGDGWAFRRRGYGLLRGRDLYVGYSNDTGSDFTEFPDLITSSQYIFDSAAWLFKHVGCNELADADDIDGVIAAWTGNAERDSSTPLRQHLYAKSQNILG